MEHPSFTQKIAIVGGGPSGLATSLFLADKRINLELIEASSTLGGLAQTFSLWGKQVELGAHFLEFGKSDVVKALLHKLFCKSEFFTYTRKTFILKESEQLFQYPPNAADLIKHMSTSQLLRSLSSYFWTKIRKKDLSSASSALITNYGKYIYYFFFYDYSLKLWAKTCDQLDACYCESMLPFRERKRFKTAIRRSSSLVAYFQNGIGELWQKVYEECAKKGVTFRLNKVVKSFRWEENKIRITFQDGEESLYDQVISTLPNAVNRRFFGLKNSQKYQFRYLVLVYLKVDKKAILKGQCVYLYNPKVQAARMIDFSQFPNSQEGFNLFLLEYWTGQNGLFSASDNAVIQAVNADLKTLKLSFRYEDFHIKRIPKAYRIPQIGLPDCIKEEGKCFDGTSFHSIGRSNSPFFNYGMDNAINEAYAISKKVSIP